MKMHKDAIAAVNTVCELFNAIPIPKNADLERELNGYSCGDFLKITLAQFMTYLAISDGTVSQNEADEIGEMMKKMIGDKHVTPEVIAQLAKIQNIYSADFASTVPSLFESAIDIDNALIEMGHAEGAVLSNTLLAAYGVIGHHFINMDGEATQSEMLNYNAYIKMLQEYRNEHFQGADETEDESIDDEQIEIDEEEDEDDIPSSTLSPAKRGVKAPKKG